VSSTGAFRSDELLPVTFTDKAAGEMRARLARLGVEGVEARTFHSAALAQLRRARGEGPGRILSTKALLLRQIGNSLPRPYRFLRFRLLPCLQFLPFLPFLPPPRPCRRRSATAGRRGR